SKLRPAKSKDVGNTYAVMDYKRLILDYHFSEFNPTTLKNADSAAIISNIKKLGVDSAVIYAKDCWGNCYFATKNFKRHKNVSQDLFGEVSKGLREGKIKVVAYYSVAWDEYAARNNPDWLRRDKDGKPIKLKPPRSTL